MCLGGVKWSTVTSLSYTPFSSARRDNSWHVVFLSPSIETGSFTETLAGWAETVVTGRARLGGIPVGIVATEGRLREKKSPADPADLTSHERFVQQVGCNRRGIQLRVIYDHVDSHVFRLFSLFKPVIVSQLCLNCV